MPGESDASDPVVRAAAERRALRATLREDAGRTSWHRALWRWCESGAVVVVTTAGGRTHRVRIVGVGADVLVADAGGGRRLVLGAAAVRAVVEVEAARQEAGSGGPDLGPTGRAEGAPEIVMADILAGLASEHSEISVWIGERATTGRLVSVGPDVAVLSTGGRGDLAYVRLDSTTEISVSVSSSL